MSILRFIKQLLKPIAKRSPIPLTKGQRMDHLTRRIMRSNLNSTSNCIDVGAHIGEILDFILEASPDGQHFAFEPLPHLYSNLDQRYSDRLKVFPYALSDQSGSTTFHYVISNPAYSGIKQRSFDRKNEEVHEINVEMRTMDDCIPKEVRIDFIKIDVEGAELYTLQGASRILQEWHPILLFEHGKGGADSYGYGPTEVWDLLCSKHGYQIYTLDGFVHKQMPLTQEALEQHFNKGDEFYFVAFRRE